jgi:CIC family chloride channel protein
VRRVFSRRGLLVAAARLRAFVRTSELSLVVVAILVGGVAGLCVTAMTLIAESAHVAFYGIPLDQRLSAAARVSPFAAFLTPALGGLALSLIEAWRVRRKAPRVVDPIEANALRGGRMSVNESSVVSVQTVISNGCGASVGLEAGYAQIGGALASRIGLAFRLRRQDLRVLVGCGAGGAIAAAFGAPLTGSFYAAELIIGSYSLANAGPIFAAALAATLTVKALGGAPYVVEAPTVASLTIEHHLALIGLGLVAAALGICAMRAAAVLETLFAASAAPRWVRRLFGGLALGAMALYTPQVLGAGHGALVLDTPAKLTAATLATLIALKLSASLISLASGFRGGLFFSSLFVGALLGKLYAVGIDFALPGLGLDPTACLLAGMGTLGVAVVGGPLTMTFLVLESTGDLGVAGGVLAACIATSLAVRSTFGYSFATWRLHLRGESIRGAQDVGWLRDLTAARLMVRAPPTFPAKGTVLAFRETYPLGSAHVVVLIDESGRYGGLVSVPEAHALALAEDDDGGPISSIANMPKTMLHPDIDVRSALAIFDAAAADTLAVTDRTTGAVLGTLSEAFAARRYAQETSQAAGDLLGGG